ncbi:hypothetical protein JCM4914_39460 [Streptomyces platensis subsp. malvinus]
MQADGNAPPWMPYQVGLSRELEHTEGTPPRETSGTTNKPQVPDLGLPYGAGDGNRTRALSSGINGALHDQSRLTWGNAISAIVRWCPVMPLVTGVDRPEGHGWGTVAREAGRAVLLAADG